MSPDIFSQGRDAVLLLAKCLDGARDAADLACSLAAKTDSAFHSFDANQLYTNLHEAIDALLCAVVDVQTGASE